MSNEVNNFEHVGFFSNNVKLLIAKFREGGGMIVIHPFSQNIIVNI